MIRRVGLVGLFLVGVLAVGFGILVISSMSYDESDPRDRPNSYYSVVSAEVDRPVADVFRFVQYEIRRVYPETSPMHEKFEILNADGLVEGAEVDCVEGDAKELVRNRYVVTEVVPNRLLVLASSPTVVLDRATGQQVAEVDVWNHFDFEPLGRDRTRLTQTVVMDMKSPFIKSAIDVFAFLSGNRGLWERQFTEELENLAAFAGGAGPGPAEAGR